MKINGRLFDGPSVETVVFPRQGGDVVFRAKAVLDFKPFEQICPTPIPKTVMKPGGERLTLLKEPVYVKAINDQAQRQTDWMVLQSLSATDGLEWDTVDLGDPSTWHRWVDELKSAGFSMLEINNLIDATTTACGMNQEKIEEATKRFLAGPVEEVED